MVEMSLLARRSSPRAMSSEATGTSAEPMAPATDDPSSTIRRAARPPITSARSQAATTTMAAIGAPAITRSGSGMARSEGRSSSW